MENPEQKKSPEYKPSPDNHVPNPEMVEFFETEVYPVLSQLFEHRYPIAEVQQRYNQLATQITNRFHRPELPVKLSDVESKDNAGNNLLPMGCDFKDGQPSISLFVPTLKKIFDMEKAMNPEKHKERYEDSIVVGYLHELDHLAGGFIGTIDENLQTTIDHECLTWAETCEHTIKFFVETGREVNQSDLSFYNTWKKCGRNPYSKRWRDFMSNMYGGLKRNKGK